jgi:cell wall assembly regulator SMI1
MDVMQSIWNRIETQLQRLAPEVREHLWPGASEATLRQVETWIPIELPEEVKAVYRIHDGQAEPTIRRVEDYASLSLLFGIEIPEEVKAYYRRPDVPRCTGALVDGWSFLSLKRLCYYWLIQRNDLGLPVSWSNSPVTWSTLECASVIWHPNWLPFMLHASGLQYCIDLAPGPHGRMGQILLYNDRYDDVSGPFGPSPFLKVVAPGIQEFFSALANDLEVGRYAFDEATEMLWSKEML